MIILGQSAEAMLTVRLSDTALALCISSQDAFPRVFATSRMIALMEIAAARVMKPTLASGQLSVGVAVHIEHLAATAVDSKVRAVATFEGPVGKLFRFRIEAFDEGGLIGKGEHTRAIVSTDRLLDGAARRLESPLDLEAPFPRPRGPNDGRTETRADILAEP